MVYAFYVSRRFRHRSELVAFRRAAAPAAADEWARLPAPAGRSGPVSRQPIASRAELAVQKRYNEHIPKPIGRTEAMKMALPAEAVC